MCQKRSLLSYLFKKKMDEGTETQNSRRPDTQINTLFSPLLLGTGHYSCEGGRRGWGLEHVFFFASR